MDQCAECFEGGRRSGTIVVCPTVRLAEFKSHRDTAVLKAARPRDVRSREERPLVGRILVRTENDYWLILRLLVGGVEADNDTVLAPRVGELFDGDVLAVLGNLTVSSMYRLGPITRVVAEELTSLIVFNKKCWLCLPVSDL